MKAIRQVPAEGFDWLTKLEMADEKDRKFGKVVYRPAEESAWDNWTQAQYDEWQDEHKPQLNESNGSTNDPNSDPTE